MTSTIEYVNPEMARTILAEQALIAEVNGRPTNRKVQKQRVANYARQMREGKWLMNGVPLIFNGSKMLDGQHRLAAVAMSGVTIPMLVVRGVDEQAFGTIDVGKTRSTADILSVRGVSNTALSAATASAVMTYLMYGDFSLTPDRRFGHKEIEDFVLGHEARMASAIHAVGTAHQAVGAPATLAALAFLVNTHPAREEFFRRLEDGVALAADSPLLHLRRLLMIATLLRSRRALPIRAAWVVKAWNAYITAQPVKVLRWRDDEAYPSIVGVDRVGL